MDSRTVLSMALCLRGFYFSVSSLFFFLLSLFPLDSLAQGIIFVGSIGAEKFSNFDCRFEQRWKTILTSIRDILWACFFILVLLEL
jgi:hypothetical protein